MQLLIKIAEWTAINSTAIISASIAFFSAMTLNNYMCIFVRGFSCEAPEKMGVRQNSCQLAILVAAFMRSALEVHVLLLLSTSK